MVIESNASAVAAQIMERARRLEIAIRGIPHAVGEAAGETAKPILQEYTPVDTGRLRASAEVEAIVSGNTLLLDYREPAQNPRTGFPYALALILGHRIVAWGHDTGRYTQPRPYPSEAAPEMLEMIRMVLAEEGHAALQIAVRAP